jgi:hypothetical protein
MKHLTSALICLFATSTQAQTLLATLEVNTANSLHIPLKTDLDAITSLPDSLLLFREATGNKKSPIPFQIQGNPRALHWILSPTPTAKKRVFELVRVGKQKRVTPAISTTKNDGALLIKTGDRNLLQYNFKTVYPPAGVDDAFKRSGFIHPLWSPKGQVLTRIQPKDHYHHYGIWNPWTHLLYKGDTLDLWNLNAKQGTVRFAKFISVKSGNVFAEYSALHEHVAFRKSGEEVMLNEIQSVRIYKPEHTDYYIADITIDMRCASSDPVLLLEYRYGGLGWRTTEQWTKDNSTVLTSEGKNRKDADGTKARWCLVQGAVDNEQAGVLMISSPDNYNHPEPLRIWPENQYNRGDMFANFDPTKDKDWLLEPGKNYVLKYRFVVFNGPFDKEKSETAWQAFSSPPSIAVNVNSIKN